MRGDADEAATLWAVRVRSCVHPFIIGVPHRIGALDSALAYILRHEGVWRATGSEIGEHYLASGATI